MGNSNYIKLILSVLFISLSFSHNVFAQCAMCRGAAETSVESGSVAATGINTAVVYLLSITLIVLCTLMFLAWKYRNQFTSVE